MDISGGGIRLSCAEEDIEFVLGQTYAGCQIDLPEVGKINVTIIVKSQASISPKPGHIIKRKGAHSRISTTRPTCCCNAMWQRCSGLKMR